MSKVAVILSGCGVFDGTEIHEATATLLALDKANADVTICAPAIAQMHVVDHHSGSPVDNQSRDVLIESARIARGPVADISDLNASNFDAVIITGGFGAAKNLCTFAVDGPECTINLDVADFLVAARESNKVIGAMCIAPALVAKLFGNDIKVTIGNDPGTAAAINATGATHVEATVNEVVVDESAKIVTTPAYMLAQNITEVFSGIQNLVDKVLELA
ncbi:MAG: isoprenoid biosynthesis glyoxalase ElbB [bacterium]|nr:isoprenoid biosynthesis glyoxalase ElbB [bacterium]MCP4800136.1 isoprenoid biosynthesis glyoxalase ElbB [bacterium]